MSDYPNRLAVVEAALPPKPPGLRAREVSARIECYAHATVRTTLSELLKQGRVTYDGPDGSRRWWRVT